MKGLPIDGFMEGEHAWIRLAHEVQQEQREAEYASRMHWLKIVRMRRARNEAACLLALAKSPAPL